MTKESPKVTIIAPCFNHKEFLEESLLSVSNQTFKDFKVIIFDDNSKDNSYELLQNLAKLDKRFHINKNQHNLGAIKNIRKHLSKVNSEYVSLFSLDDVMLKDHLEKLLDNLNNDSTKYKNRLGAASLLFTNKNFNKKYKLLNSLIIFISRFRSLYIDIDLFIIFNIFFSPISLVVPKSCINELLKIEHIFTTSTDYLLLALSMAKKDLLLKIVPDFTTFYRKHSGNISNIENFHHDRKQIIKYLKENDYIDKNQFLFYKSIYTYREIPSFKNTLKLIFLSLNYIYLKKQFFRPFLITGLTLTIAQGIFKIFRVKRN